MYLRDNKFIISCPARSGSTMLSHLLRSNPRVTCHGEVFGGEQIGHLVGTYAARRKADPEVGRALLEYRTARPASFLYDIVFDAQGRDAVGFKFKTDEALDPRYADVQEIVRSDLDIKILQLRRRNVLDQFISHQVVLNQTGVTWIRSEEERPPVEPFQADVRQAVAYVLDVLEREEAVPAIYSGHRHMMVDYEDLLDESHPARAEVQEFLGVESAPMSTATRKILDSNADLVTNVSEVRDALRLMGLADRC